MYTKYLLKRVQYGRAKLWRDYKAWKNAPGMQVKDVYDVIPASHHLFYLAPGNVKKNPQTDPYLFLEDYKKPYRYSRYFQRKLTPADEETSITFVNKLSEKDEKKLNAHFQRFPGQKERYNDKPVMNFLHTASLSTSTANTANTTNTTNTPSTNDVFQNIRNYVRATYSKEAIEHLHPEITFLTKSQPVSEDKYLMPFEVTGYERMVDSLDGNYQWHKVYFDSLQKLYDLDDYYKNELDYKLPVYVGKTKRWQGINDNFGKDEVDKVQVAIGAPVQEQLDLWDEENDAKFIQLPVSNENQAKFRDVPGHHEVLDRDYDGIVYERARNQAFESMRNMRYWELERSLHKDEHH